MKPTQEAPSGDVVERVRKAIVGFVFAEAQPDRGDVFSWFDDRAEQLSRTAIAALASTAGDTLKAENERYRTALNRIKSGRSSVVECYLIARTALGSDQ